MKFTLLPLSMIPVKSEIHQLRCSFFHAKGEISFCSLFLSSSAIVSAVDELNIFAKLSNSKDMLLNI